MQFSKSKFLLLYLIFAASGIIKAQDTLKYTLNNIFVTSSRTPVSFSDVSRSVKIISAEEIKDSPVNSVADLLAYSAGVDVRQRGVEGVQADVSIRGGSFEQVLVLIDGVPVNDPQTGHHNMNIPLSMQDIERIEILKGQGSKIFGPDALSGAINIITKKNSGTSVSGMISGGQNAFYEGYLGGSANFDNISFRLSADKKKSDGFQPNTDFEFANYTGSLSYSGTSGSANLMFGYVDKSFGANGFYAGNAEWERILTRFYNLSGEIGDDKFYVSPKFYFRQNYDDYVYLRTNPAAYRNNHITYTYGSEIQMTYKTGGIIFSGGGSYGIDSIKSNRLGQHKREKYGFFAEALFYPVKKLSVNLGSFASKYAGVGWKFWPGIDAAYHLDEHSKVFASFGKAFRLPTYTELYYQSASSVGNPQLKYEEVTNYEIGFSRSSGSYKFSLSGFRKEGKNNIDWVDAGGSGVWKAENFAKVNTNGLETSFTLSPGFFTNLLPGTGISINYVYMNSDKNTGGKLSRDYLETMRHQVIANLTNEFPAGIKSNIAVRYENRLNLGDIFLVDGNVEYEISHIEIFLKLSNIFDRRYKKHLFAELPGRWAVAGIRFDLSDN